MGFVYDVVGGGPFDGGAIGVPHPLPGGAVVYIHTKRDGVAHIYHTVYCPKRHRILLYFSRQESLPEREVHGC